MTFLCVNCDHNLTTLLATTLGYDPDEICSACVEEEALRVSVEDQMDYDQVLEDIWSSFSYKWDGNGYADFWDEPDLIYPEY